MDVGCIGVSSLRISNMDETGELSKGVAYHRYGKATTIAGIHFLSTMVMFENPILRKFWCCFSRLSLLRFTVHFCVESYEEAKIGNFSFERNNYREKQPNRTEPIHQNLATRQ